MTIAQSISAGMLKTWAVVKGGPIEKEIRGLWGAASYLAGKAILIEGNKLHDRPDGDAWEPIDHQAVSAVQSTFAKTGKLTGKTILIEFQDNERAVRNFLRIAIRTGSTLEQAANVAGIRRLSAAPSVEWVPAINLLQTSDAGIISHFLTAYRNAAQIIAGRLATSNSDILGANTEIEFGGAYQLGTAIRERGVDRVFVSLNVIPANVFTGAKYRAAVRDGVDKALRLLAARGMAANGTEIGRYEIADGQAVVVKVAALRFGWAQIEFRKA